MGGYEAYVTCRYTLPGQGGWLTLGTNRRAALQRAWEHLDERYVPSERPVALIVRAGQREALSAAWEKARRLHGRARPADAEAFMRELRALERRAIVARLRFDGWARRVERY